MSAARWLYQSGTARQVHHNFHVIGKTKDCKTGYVFTEPLNFRDDVLEVVKGWVSLESYKISGRIRFEVDYSLSGVDTEDEDMWAERNSDDDMFGDVGGRTWNDSGGDVSGGGGDGTWNESGDSGRFARVTQGIVRGVLGNWRAGMTLEERCAALDVALNKM